MTEKYREWHREKKNTATIDNPRLFRNAVRILTALRRHIFHTAETSELEDSMMKK